MFVPFSDIYPSRTPDPPTVFCHKYEKIKKNILFLNRYRNFFLANSQRIVVLSSLKIATKLKKYGFGIPDSEKPYSGSLGLSDSLPGLKPSCSMTKV
jgi:hypothetical protein